MSSLDPIPFQPPPDRKYIQCDNESCGETSPPFNCSRCKLVYYCSADCQRRHWLTHKKDCHPVDEMKAKMKHMSSSGDVPIQMAKQVELSEGMLCGICQEEEIQRPHALNNCRHVFCYPCLQSYQSICKRMEQPLRCPLCRGEVEDVQRCLWENAFFLVQQADREPTSDKRDLLLEKALHELELISQTDLAIYLQALFTKVQALRSLARYEEALKAVEDITIIDNSGREKTSKVLQMLDDAEAAAAAQGQYDEAAIMNSLDEAYDLAHEQNCFLRLRPFDRIELLTEKASLYEKLEEWDKAVQSYKNVFIIMQQMNTEGTPPQQRELFMGLSRCLYHQGDLSLAIQLGEAAIEMNRHYPRVHEHVALSYKAKGDLETATRLMTQAVLYETPWDEKNIHHAKQILDALMREDQT